MLNSYYKIANQQLINANRRLARLEKECKRHGMECNSIDKKAQFLNEEIITHEEILNHAFVVKAATEKILIAHSENHAQFITIRPKEETQWIDFYPKIIQLMNRKIWKDFTLTFEQKGESDETLGKGFHVHIVATSSHRSKGELIRDICSTLNGKNKDSMVMQNCIDVKKTTNPAEVIQNYLIDYISNDDHKIKTKIWDQKWRESLGLKPLFVSNIKLLPPQQAREVVVETVSTVVDFS